MGCLSVIAKCCWLVSVAIGVWQLQLVASFSTSLHRHRAAARRRRTTKATRRLSSTVSNEDRYNTTSFLIVDVDNVRGKSNFLWTHESLLESATEWRNTFVPSSMLALVVDHGSMASLHTEGPLDDRVGVFFSGDTKADDVIVSLIQECSSAQTVVVTADQGLKLRCQQASTKDSSRQLDFMEPVSFLSEIESLSTNEYTLRLTESNATDTDDNNNVVENVGDSIRLEVALREELQMLNRLLNPRGTRPSGKKKQISKKQRTKLAARRDRARERLQQLLEQENQSLSSVLERDSEPSTLNGAVHAITNIRVSTYSTESTYERQLLAERLRRRLDRAGTISFPTDEDSDLSTIHDILWNARSSRVTSMNGESESGDSQSINRGGRSLSSSVLKVPRRSHNEHSDDDDTPATLLRIVAISDTHGYEHELFAHNTGGEKPYLLPPADVLLHCGDFTENGSRKIKMQAKARLDAFLAAQTHIPTKIVIRGNHDPHTPARVLFPRSKAIYVTKPMTMTLQHNVTLGLRPFSRRGTILLLPPCDILASHSPPYGILDLTYQRVRAGSMTLRRAVEASKDKPSAWICGHIHEGRASLLHTFADEHTAATTRSTLVINVANANAGRANRIVTGPVLVDVVKDMSLLQNSSEWTAGATANSSPVKLIKSDSIEHMVSAASETTDGAVDSRRLLAVDLGLRTAMVILDGNGKILDVQDFRFTNHSQLEGALQQILHNNTITHVVVEGNDAKLVRIWRKAVEKYESDLPFARVVAEDWRESLLLPKERKNKQAAKDAAVLIAKQFWNKKLEHETKSKLTKDAAEAILVGQYAVRVLGWVDPTLSAVKRYANGNIAR